MAAHDPAGARAGAVPGEALLATVVTGLPQDGDDVRRRDMITSIAALAGAAALSRAPGATGSPRNPAGGLEDVLYGHVEAAPVDAGKLRAAVTAVRGDFRDARYDRVPAALPKIIAAAQATRDNAGAGERAEGGQSRAEAGRVEDFRFAGPRPFRRGKPDPGCCARTCFAAGLARMSAIGFKHIAAAWRDQSMPAAVGLEPNGALAYAPGPGGYFERDALAALALVTRALPSVREIGDAVTALRDRYPARTEIITSPLETTDVLARLELALPGWDRADSGGLASFTSGDHRYLVRRSGTEAATRVYAEAPPDSVRQVRSALGQSRSPGGGSGT